MRKVESSGAWKPNVGGSAMDDRNLKLRTRAFALRIIRLTNSLPGGRVPEVVGMQLLRSGTSVGANYRAACRARSNAEFVAKLGIVEEELDESIYWVEILEEAGIIDPDLVRDLKEEADQLLAITVASIKTARSGK
jgi:four helix bundle protein